MRRLACLVLSAILTCAAPALAQPADPRLQVVPYDPAAVVELKGVLGYLLTVEFDPAERIENVAIGDALGWQVTPNRQANILFIKPMSQRPPTNMTVITNLRRYTFQLSIRSGKIAPQAVTYSLRFSYPAPAMAVVEPPAPPAPPRVVNQAYTYQGSADALPQRVFDDGEFTYLTFRRGGDLPAIFSVDPDGKEATVSTHMRDDYLVVERLAPEFVLRRGSEVTRIFNDGFTPERPGPLSPKLKPKDPWWRR
jgi:type IV secretion system protein VirB9